MIDTDKFYFRDENTNRKFMNFLDQLTKTIMFNQFFEKYITKSEKNYKYKTIKSYLKLITNQEERNSKIIGNYNRERIRSKLINYYDVRKEYFY